eukprot:TRINITY_DN533_c1_g1_i3.p1 TRINITY_DN533_c1_g1~~TRINITY_DN533_c1_g1_i3.p1  ORF type:complete len:474 (+),score=13.93 TRINITY_DN533_c1_g1_i3:387-1808(+)
MIKLHKKEIGMRWITGVSTLNDSSMPLSRNQEKKDEKKKNSNSKADSGKPRAATTSAHLHLSSLLKKVMQILKQKDSHCKYNRYWIVDSDEEIALDIKQHVLSLRHLHPKTHDFTNMYTALPHPAIKEKVLSAIEEAMEYAQVSNLQPLNPAFESCTKQEIQALLEFCIDNSYVFMNGKIWRQTTGIPMGGNSCGDIANLYCYSVESKHIDSLVESGNIKAAKSFSFSRRYIDDFLSWNNAPPPQELYLMSYKDTSDSFDDVRYIGIRIRIENAKKSSQRWLRLSVADKARGWHIQPTRFSHRDSCAPESIGTGIFTTMCLRALKLGNNFPDFETELEAIIYRLLNRMYSEKALFSCFNKLVNNEINDGNLAKKLRRDFKSIIDKYVRGYPIALEKDFIGPRTPQDRFPINAHTSPGEGVIAGECGWAAINFIADHLHKERVTFASVQEIQLGVHLCQLQRTGDTSHEPYNKP